MALFEPMQVAGMRLYSDNDDYVKYLGPFYSPCLIVLIKSNGRHRNYVAPIGGAPRSGDELRASLTNRVGTEFISERPLPARSQLANIAQLNEALRSTISPLQLWREILSRNALLGCAFFAS